MNVLISIKEPEKGYKRYIFIPDGLDVDEYVKQVKDKITEELKLNESGEQFVIRVNYPTVDIIFG